MEELEAMRQQLADMKRRLDTQQIVNDTILRSLMRRKASWLNRFVTLEIIIVPLTYIALAVICAGYGISQWYASVFLICSVIDVIFDRRTIRIPPEIFSELSLIQLRKFIVRQKKERFIQTIIATPLVIIWVVAFLAAVYSSLDFVIPDDSLSAAKTGGFVGGVAGTVLGTWLVYIIYKKMQRTNDSLLSDINELESEK